MTGRPAGADNFLRWRRSIDEHLELRRLTWDEYAMFNWLCTKAHPHTGIVRTGWPVLAAQTGLTPNHVEQLCRSLKCKRYIWYPPHRGRRRRLVEVAIHKFPVAAGVYTDLSARFAEVPADVPAEVPTEVDRESPDNSRTSTPSIERKRERERERPRPRPGWAAYPTGVTRLWS